MHRQNRAFPAFHSMRQFHNIYYANDGLSNCRADPAKDLSPVVGIDLLPMAKIIAAPPATGGHSHPSRPRTTRARFPR